MRGSMIVLLASLSLARADSPAGKIIIRPGAEPLIVPAATSPSTERPGMIVIRPQAPGQRILENAPRPTTAQQPITPTSNPPPMSNSSPPKHNLPASTTNLPPPTPRPVPEPKSINTPVGKSAEQGPATKAPDKIIAETWDVAFVKGYKVGYFHVLIREYEKDGQNLIYATKKQEITLGRFGQVVTTTAEDITLESQSGEVLAVRMMQEVSTGQRLSITGQVKGELLHVRGDGLARGADTVPWPEGVIGIAREHTLYKDRKPQPGDTFDYNIYEGRLNRVVRITVTCKSLETVALIEGQEPKPYLRIEAQMDKIGEFQLPPATIWVDPETYMPVRTDQDLPHVGGRLTLLRTTKEVALRPVGQVPDQFDAQSIRLDRDIPEIHDKAAVTYRFEIPIDPNPMTCFPKDPFSNRQVATLVDKAKKIIDIKVLGQRQVQYAAPEDSRDTPNEKLLKEAYLGTSFFIDWDNELTKQQAAAIAQTLAAGVSNLEKGRAVETWVHRNMKSADYTQAMAPTSEVSKSLSGDCTEYSMLAVGLCRALGVPARTALGLVYATGRDGKSYLAYHMWFEVWTGEHWVPLDATLGRGGIGPGHLRITHAHWHKEQSFAPLLPVLRVVVAQPKVTVLEVEDAR